MWKIGELAEVQPVVTNSRCQRCIEPPKNTPNFEVSALPDDWPTDWKTGRFAFPEVYPQMPTRKDYPPEQVNVDQLATFVID